METKPFWQSKTFWVNIIAILVTVTGALGFDLGLDAEAQVMWAGTIMGVVNIVLRVFFTDKAIG